MNLTKSSSYKKTVWFCGCSYYECDNFDQTIGHEKHDNKQLFQTEYICTLKKKYMIEKWEKCNQKEVK